MRGALLALALILAAPDSAALAHEDPCGDKPTYRCVGRQAWRLLRLGEPRKAIDYLKHHRGLFEEAPQLAHLLARVYLDSGNRVWAHRTLTTQLRNKPDDCEALGFLAWVLIADARFKAAVDVLRRESCPKADVDRARWAMLRAFIAKHHENMDAAEEDTTTARGSPEIYAEDASLLTHLERAVWPNRQRPFRFQGQLKVGWTSNPLLGSPMDPTQQEGDFASAIGELKLWSRIGTRFYGPFRPFVELDITGVGLEADASEDFSYISWAVAPGVALGGRSFLLRANYRFDAVLLAGGDRYDTGPLWFYQGHRAELRAEIGPSLTIFASGGHREFRELGRTRWELDLGIGGGGALGDRVFLLGALSGRAFSATNEAYDMMGTTLLGSAQIALGAGFSVRLAVSLALDDYPDSKGFFATEARQDVLFKGRIGVWSPRLPLASRMGISYEPSHRESSADQYTFTDHRVLFHLRMTLDADPWLPRAARLPDHVPVDYGLGAGREGLSDRLQELLRQDEDAQRGSSCLNR